MTGASTQVRIEAFIGDGRGEDRELTFPQVLKLAREKYGEDWAVREWLKLYENGTRDIVRKKGKKKEVLKGIEPGSEFAMKGLRRAIELRESGKVMLRR